MNPICIRLIICLCLIGTGCHPVHTAKPANVPHFSEPCHLDQLGWLKGQWVSRQGKNVTKEHWLFPHPRIMLGSAWSTENGRETFFEHLQIECHASSIRLNTWPNGQGPYTFTLVSHQNQQAIFARESHSPQRIVYQRQGSLLFAYGEDAPGRRLFSLRFHLEAASTIKQTLTKQILVQADRDTVWKTWTTAAGLQSFFAPQAKVEMRPGGSYELYFYPHAVKGRRGNEGCTIVEIEKPRRLVFTWDFPVTLPRIREAHTLVTIELSKIHSGQTRVKISQTGWRSDADWDRGYTFFDRAWEDVLGRLKQRFDSGPIRWKDVLGEKIDAQGSAAL